MKKHNGPQIVAKLREADVALGKGLTVPEVCKKIGVSEQTYYRWRHPREERSMDRLMAGPSSWHCLKSSLLGVTTVLFAESKNARHI